MLTPKGRYSAVIASFLKHHVYELSLFSFFLQLLQKNNFIDLANSMYTPLFPTIMIIILGQ